jgi:ATP/ADP translocase/HEAT repeat protein
MYRLLESLFSIRRGEISRSLLMFLYGFALLSCYYILKTVSKAVFLHKFGAGQLPFMYMAIALVAGVVASVYGSLARRTRLDRLMVRSQLFIIANLVLFWWTMSQQINWIVYVFYIWVSLFGVITVSQLWLLANYLFDAREAKRLFPFVAAGLSAGALAGSKTSHLFAALVGSINLLWIGVGLIAACGGLVLVLWPMRSQSPARRRVDTRRRDSKVRGLWSLLTSSRHLKLLAGIIGLTVMVSTIVELQFMTVVKQAFEEKDALTAFLGNFYFFLSLASLTLQFLFSYRIVRRFGVGIAILILPTVILLGTSAFFLWPVLWCAVLLRGSESSFRYSVNKAGGELLFMPIPAGVKDRAKALMDVVGDRFARGIGGALLFLVQHVLKWPVQRWGLLSGGIIAIWIVLAVLIRREYSRSFRSALELRTLDSGQVRVQLRDAGSIAQLAKALTSTDTRQVRFALELTADFQDKRLQEPLVDLLSHSDADVRATALTQLAQSDKAPVTDRVLPLVTDPDPGVRHQALHFLSRRSPDEGRRQLARLLADTDPRLRATAIQCALRHCQDLARDDASLNPQIEQLLSATEDARTREARRILADAFQYLAPDDPLSEWLPRLLQDPDPAIVRGALNSVGVLRKREFLSASLALLADYRMRNAAREALIAYGPRILGTLRDHVTDPQVPLSVRRAIPKVISHIGTQEAVSILFTTMERDDWRLRFQIVKGLNRLRRASPDLRFERATVERYIEEEARQYYEYTTLKSAARPQKTDAVAVRLLHRALDERRGRHLNQFFRFTGLIYPQDDMRFAHSALTRGQPGLRASAIEFLDTVWSRRHKEILFPVFEARDEHHLTAAGLRLYGLKIPTRLEGLAALIHGGDGWLAACAVHVVHRERQAELKPDLEALRDTTYKPLSEAVQAALREM